MLTSLSVTVAKDLMPRNSSDATKNFERVTGIKKTRRWKGDTLSLASQAVRQDMGRIQFHEPGAVIFVTQSPDRNSPSMANDIARMVGLPANAPVFDVNQSCTGFIYGLWLGGLVAKQTKSALVVCVDKLRAKPDSSESMIFSDAACAFMVTDEEQCRFMTDGTGVDKLRGGEGGLLEMDGGAVFDFVTNRVPKFIKEYDEGGLHEVLVQHQANLSMMKMVDRRSGFEGRSIHSIEEFGNMSMVSIPAAIALHESELVGKSVLLCGYGAGWSAAMASLYWPKNHICELQEVSG